MMFWRKCALAAVIFAMSFPGTAFGSLYGRAGSNQTTAGALIAGYGTSAANWVPDSPTLDSTQDPVTGFRGCLVNSIYVYTATGANYEIGWYKTYENPDNAQAFAARVKPSGVYMEWPLGRVNDNCTNYFSLNHVPGTYNYIGYINGAYMHTFTEGGISSSWSIVGAERFRPGDRNEASFEQLKYRPTDTSWASWDRVREQQVTTPDPGYFFYGDSSLKKAKVY